MLIGPGPLTYEVINLALWLLCLGVLAIFGRYLAVEWTAGKITLRNLAKHHEMAVAIAFMVAGEMGIRFWTWLWRFTVRVNLDTTWMAEMPFALTPVLTSAVQMAGLMLCIKVFAPDSWGSAAWIGIVAAVVFFMLVSLVAGIAINA